MTNDAVQVSLWFLVLCCFAIAIAIGLTGHKVNWAALLTVAKFIGIALIALIVFCTFLER